MKVQFIPAVSNFFNRIQGSQDKQGGSGQNAYQQQQKKQDQQENEVPVTEETVRDAIDQFAADKVHTESGITAEMAGRGPGLRVVLKDAGGGVLRNVTGEEFLKLREAAKSGAKSGKILDQKV